MLNSVEKNKMLITEDDSTNMLMDFMLIELNEGDSSVYYSSTKEIALLLQSGEIEVSFENSSKLLKRRDVFLDEPMALHFPKNIEIKIKANSKSEILYVSTTNTNEFKPKFYPQSTEIKKLYHIEFDGKDNRELRVIFDAKIAPYSNLVLGEVINDQGCWGSYIPHFHDQPELYYYKFDHENGFGGCFIEDDVYKIKHQTYATIPGGLTHPQVTAPGYKMYICWIIRHLDGNKWYDRIDDEQHLHLLENTDSIF